MEVTEEESMSNRKYTEEFKSEAIRQMIEWCYKVWEANERL